MATLEKSPPEPDTATRHLNILVADDVEEITDLVRRWLEAEGHVVTRAFNGREVIELVQKQRFDILVTDIVMPGMDGWDAILAVGRMRPDIRILAISGGGKLNPADACLRLAKGVGADLALRKPFRREDFLAAIAKLATRRPPEHTVIGKAS